MNILLLIVGCFMEGTAALIILVPILLQIIASPRDPPGHLGTIVV
jgi:TRAP-type C4-dicarboxylate transport system permease large subunit